jgi:hypothetical protein
MQNAAHLERILYLCLTFKKGAKSKEKDTIITKAIVAPIINNMDLINNMLRFYTIKKNE